MAKKTSKKATKSSKKKAKGNVFTKIIIVVFVLILILFFAFRYIPSLNFSKKQNTETQLVSNDSNKDKTIDNDAHKEEKVSKPVTAKSIQGSWMSTTGGAVLTMKDKEYRIDFMGVDIGEPITGNYSIENEIITFTNSKEPLKKEKGVYEIRFENHEISFKCKDDDLTKRKATLVTEWEWLEE